MAADKILTLTLSQTLVLTPWFYEKVSENLSNPHYCNSVMSQSAHKPARYPDSKSRILVAEDNLINQKVVSYLLSTMGFTSDIAANGVEALLLLENGNYDVVLMDLQMPVMDGLEATRAIRSLAGPVSRIPIIAVTANAMQSDRDRCLAAGMNDFLSKPIETAKFVAALKRWTRDKTNSTS